MANKSSLFKHRLESDRRRYGERHGGDAALDIIQDAARQKDREYLRYLADQVGLSYAVAGKTALFWLAGTDDIEAVEMLVNCGAAVQPSPGSGVASPLMHAAYCNRLDMAKLLVEHGAKVDYSDPNGDTALSIARERGHAAMAAFLEACLQK
ncbi:MAG: ankyrin repeat domain-containing protein [Saprospiraceae bacterium]